MSEINKLDAADLKVVKDALKCPATLIKSDGERKFLAETKERLNQFGNAIRLSEKQLSWLRKISQRKGAGSQRSKPEPSSPSDGDYGEMPNYDELAGG